MDSAPAAHMDFAPNGGAHRRLALGPTAAERAVPSNMFATFIEDDLVSSCGHISV
jgi:hypothetical protein